MAFNENMIHFTVQNNAPSSKEENDENRNIITLVTNDADNGGLYWGTKRLSNSFYYIDFKELGYEKLTRSNITGLISKLYGFSGYGKILYFLNDLIVDFRNNDNEEKTINNYITIKAGSFGRINTGYNPRVPTSSLALNVANCVDWSEAYIIYYSNTPIGITATITSPYQDLVNRITALENK